MHYYTHNIGDYRRDTSHLSLLEHGVYRQLIDQYYLNEKPISEDLDYLKRHLNVRTPEEHQALKNVLDDFFVLEEGQGYIHKRCEETIIEYQEKSSKAAAAANSRWNANAMRTHSERNANHKPVTINHKPKKPILEGMLINRKGTNMVDINPDYPHHQDVYSFMEIFWKQYPRKVGKADALKAWMKKLPDIQIVVKALNWQKDCSHWKKGYIPNPATYINQERWNDEPDDVGF